MNYDTLREAVDAEAPVVRRALGLSACYGAYPAGSILHYQVCGAASSLLRRRLMTEHGITTERRIATLDEITTGERYVSMRHVTLRDEESGITIDPSYTQFFNLVGLVPGMVDDYPEIAGLYPTHEIAVIRAGDEEKFGHQYAEFAHRLQPRLRVQLGNKCLKLVEPNGVLMGASPQKLHATYGNLWLPGRYAPHPESESEEAEIDRLLARALAGDD